MVIARITDSYTWGGILYTVHEDCVCEGTSNRIVYYYDSSRVTEPDAWRKTVYNLDGNRVTRWTDNRVAYYVEGDYICDENHKTIAYIKRESTYEDSNSSYESDDSYEGQSDHIGGALPGGGSGTPMSGKELAIMAAIIIGIYSAIIAVVSNWLDVGFFQAFFGAPVLIAVIWFFASIFG